MSMTLLPSQREPLVASLRQIQGDLSTTLNELYRFSMLDHLKPIENDAICSLEVAYAGIEQALSMIEGGTVYAADDQ